MTTAHRIDYHRMPSLTELARKLHLTTWSEMDALGRWHRYRPQYMTDAHRRAALALVRSHAEGLHAAARAQAHFAADQRPDVAHLQYRCAQLAVLDPGEWIETTALVRALLAHSPDPVPEPAGVQWWRRWWKW